MPGIEFNWSAASLKEIRDAIVEQTPPQQRPPKEKSDSDVVQDFLKNQIEGFLVEADARKGEAAARAASRERRKQNPL